MQWLVWGWFVRSLSLCDRGVVRKVLWHFREEQMLRTIDTDRWVGGSSITLKSPKTWVSLLLSGSLIARKVENFVSG